MTAARLAGTLTLRARERGLLVGALALGALGLAAVHLALYPQDSWRPIVVGAVALAGFLVVHAALCASGHGADEVLLPVAAGLSAVGLVMVYRLRPDYLVRQAGWIALGLVALLVVLGTLRDLRWVRRYAYLFAVLGLCCCWRRCSWGSSATGRGSGCFSAASPSSPARS